jgi:tRNA(Met) C34 N-acetyltransferase TmcA
MKAPGAVFAQILRQLSPLRQFSLVTPIRWAPGCPLEALVSELLLFGDEALPNLQRERCV